MASNRVYEDGDRLGLVCTDPAVPVAGDPVICGTIAGVAVNDEAADGETVVDMKGVYRLSVKGINAGGNVAVAVGDQIFYTSADTPKLSKKATGVLFGVALEAIDSGLTASILVKIHRP